MTSYKVPAAFAQHTKSNRGQTTSSTEQESKPRLALALALNTRRMHSLSMKCVLSCTLLLGLVTLSTALQPAEAVASSLGDALEPASPSQWAQLEADDLRNDGSRDIWSIVATTYLARPTPTAGSKVAPPDDEDEDDAETEMVAVGSTRRRKRDKAANIFLTVKKLGSESIITLGVRLSLTFSLARQSYPLFSAGLSPPFSGRSCSSTTSSSTSAPHFSISSKPSSRPSSPSSRTSSPPSPSSTRSSPPSHHSGSRSPLPSSWAARWGWQQRPSVGRGW